MTIINLLGLTEKLIKATSICNEMLPEKRNPILESLKSIRINLLHYKLNLVDAELIVPELKVTNQNFEVTKKTPATFEERLSDIELLDAARVPVCIKKLGFTVSPDKNIQKSINANVSLIYTRTYAKLTNEDVPHLIKEDGQKGPVFAQTLIQKHCLVKSTIAVMTTSFKTHFLHKDTKTDELSLDLGAIKLDPSEITKVTNRHLDDGLRDKLSPIVASVSV